jgi:hypothetical protein
MRAAQKARRIKNENKPTLKYEKTPKGFLVRVYRNMKSRVTGVTKKKNHLYLGLELLDKDSFYEWSLNDPSFLELFKVWTESSYPRRSTPSIDRIDSNKGYTPDNIQWITFSENCSKVTRSKGIKNG